MTEEQTAGQMTQDVDLMQFVPKVHFEQIPIRNLVSNQEYQRNLSQHHVQRAAANFDLYQINPVKVSRRNGINYGFTDSTPLRSLPSFRDPGRHLYGAWSMTTLDMNTKQISSQIR